MSDRIPLSEPVLGALERELVGEAMDSGMVSSAGPFVRRFEEEFADRVGSRHAVACSTGTAALHLALVAVGVTRDDVVAISDFTFIASANAAKYEGADLLLIDSEEDTWNLDPELLSDELGRRARAGERMPRALELVHVLGQPADLTSILQICRQHDIALVEDAAESLGATVELEGKPRQVGTVGAAGAFSFNGNKIITAGGGGMVVTDDPDLAGHVRHLSTQARVPAAGYLHDAVGYNYRLTNVAAALGLAQLRGLDERIEARRDVAARYRAALDEHGFQPPPDVDGMRSTFWLYSTLLPEELADRRDELVRHLADVGIEARPLWRPLAHQPPLSASQRVGGRVGDDIFRRGISLPSSFSLTRADQDRVIAAVGHWVGQASGASSRRSRSS